ncbi:MAG: ATP-binding protein [Bacteriovoracales bacterium]|nr:ATP-binding protein [Bacteriovoracales bacterium]
MERFLKEFVQKDLENKMVFIGGPRQVGKTTFAMDLAPPGHRYLNWDISSDRKFILNEFFPAEDFIVYDEIHKFHQWRNYLKGLYDKYKNEKKILATGSARLDYYRHSGDSLQGRYHYYRLHPFTVKELQLKSSGDIQDLLNLGGFPEPFLSGQEQHAKRWRREYHSRIIYDDISVLELSQNLSKMEQLLLRLPRLVSAPLSLNSLREDLQVAHKTVAKWLDIFERMYFIYRISPYQSNQLRAVKKEQKHYHFNWAEVADRGARFENLIAGHLMKWAHFQQDHYGENIDLHYFRDTDKREVDFVVTHDGKVVRAVECKLVFKEISPALKYFQKKFPETECVQVHLKSDNEFITKEGIKALGWRTFLEDYI